MQRKERRLLVFPRIYCFIRIHLEFKNEAVYEYELYIFKKSVTVR
jgi:hypothetical protein